MQSSEAPSVTILIDTYNYARFVGRAMESAIQQEYAGPEPEILVVDDGSTDDTAEVVCRYAPRVRYVTKDRSGQASALNLGFREARGDIVCLLDGDDYFYPGKVQLVADAFRRRPEVGLVYDEFDIVDGAGASLGKVFPEPTWTGYRLPLAKVSAQLRQLIRLGHPWTAITSAMSVRRSVMVRLEVPEAVFPHSPDLFLGLVLPFLTEVAIIETPGTAYVYHGDNVGLFRSSEENRVLYAQQLSYIRSFLAEHFGVCFPHYGGRSIYGRWKDRRTGIDRLAEWLEEARQLAAADVDSLIKRRSQIKLAAALLLPDVLYNELRELRATRRRGLHPTRWVGRQARSLRRGLTRVRREGGGL